MRAAVIFDHLGPYHRARLQAAARRVELKAIELAGASADYPWARPTDNEATFEAATLFEKSVSSQVSLRRLASALESALTKTRPEAVLIPGWSSPAALSALRWCWRQNVPPVVMSESTESDEPRRWWKERVKRRVVSLCPTALVGGKPQRDYLHKLGMPFDRVFLGYDAVDNDYFANRTAAVRRQPATFRSQSRLPETYFLASARSVEKKNLPRLLQAYARYRDLHRKSTTPALQKPLTSQLSTLNLTVLPHQPSTSPWSLVLLGDGPLRNSAPERSGVPLRNSLNSQLATLNLQSSVHLPGFKQYDELPTYYGLAGAFVHASTTEPWGLVVNEAMASGLPVLVSNRCGCAPDLVQEGRNGFTFAPLNVDELAGLMLKLAAMPREQLADMGNAGREIISHWGPDRFAAGLRQAVELALRLPRPRPTTLDRMLLWTLARRKNWLHRNLQ